MSFILESIKQAERERKLGQAPSITVEYAAPMENFDDRKDWIKWAGIIVGFLLAVLAAWIGIKMTSNNFFVLNSEVLSPISEQKVFAEKENVAVTSAVVKKQESFNSNIVEHSYSEGEVHFTSAKDLRNSELKEVQIIDHQQQEPQLEIVDKRTKIIQQDEIQATEVDHSEKVAMQDSVQLTQINKEESIGEIIVTEAAFSKNKVIQSSPEQIGGMTNRDEIYTQYSNLSASIEDQVLPQDSPVNIQYIDEEVIRSEEPELLASVEPNISTNLKRAVDTGISEFGELPYDVQENVPDINISVHMFNEDPSNRRIRINGRMYTEGTNLQQDLALVEITRYGAVFDYQGHLFRLNVR